MTSKTLIVAAALLWLASTTNWLASAAPQQAGPDPANVRVGLEPFVQGLENPVAFAAPEDGSGRLFVVEKPGRIRIIQNGVLQARPFLDLTGKVESAANERGLLGLAFHPQFVDNGYFVVGYTAKSPLGQVTYARFQVTADPGRADPASEKRIIAWAHARGNHNGGDVQFGPDGYLYLGTGDGGGGGDPDRNGQNGQTFLGKMLRLDIDVDANEPYAIPADNPFVGDAAIRDEIWALGLRNPWRYTFDSATGDLYIGDVGQNQWEEVDHESADDPGGHNYGWRIMEGTHCYNAADCDQTGLTMPILEYSHGGGHCSVTGGYVYRGQAFPNLVGLYFYADYCSNVIWAASRDEQGMWRSAEVGRQPNLGIQSFGEDADGELYVLGSNGRIMRLVDRSGSIAPSTTPTAEPTDVSTATAEPATATATVTRPTEPTATATATVTPPTEPTATATASIPATATPTLTVPVPADWSVYLPLCWRQE